MENLNRTTKENFYKFLKGKAWNSRQGNTFHSTIYYHLNTDEIIAYMEGAGSWGGDAIYMIKDGDVNYDATNFITNLINKI